MPPPSRPRRRRNGVTWPPHPLQASSWVLFGVFTCSYYALFDLYLGTAGRIAAGVVFGFFALSTFIAAAFATSADPADKNIYLREDAYDNGEVPPGLLYCHRCERYVQETSKHCVVCQKCVDAFDHHCVWLNNCVGIHNYMAFITSLIGATGMLTVEIAVGIYLLVQFGHDRDRFEARVHEFYPALSGQAYIGLTTAVTIIDLLTLGLIIQLLAFHSYLIDHNITTYDFVVHRSRVDYDAPEEKDACQTCQEENKRGEQCKPGKPGDDCKPKTPGGDCRDPDNNCGQKGRPARPPQYHGKGSVISIWRARKEAGNLDGLGAFSPSAKRQQHGVELPTLPKAGGGSRDEEEQEEGGSGASAVAPTLPALTALAAAYGGRGDGEEGEETDEEGGSNAAGVGTGAGRRHSDGSSDRRRVSESERGDSTPRSAGVRVGTDGTTVSTHAVAVTVGPAVPGSAGSGIRPVQPVQDWVTRTSEAEGARPGSASSRQDQAALRHVRSGGKAGSGADARARGGSAESACAPTAGGDMVVGAQAPAAASEGGSSGGGAAGRAGAHAGAGSGYDEGDSSSSEGGSPTANASGSRAAADNATNHAFKPGAGRGGAGGGAAAAAAAVDGDGAGSTDSELSTRHREEDLEFALRGRTETDAGGLDNARYAVAGAGGREGAGLAGQGGAPGLSTAGLSEGEGEEEVSVVSSDGADEGEGVGTEVEGPFFSAPPSSMAGEANDGFRQGQGQEAGGLRRSGSASSSSSKALSVSASASASLPGALASSSAAASAGAAGGLAAVSSLSPGSGSGSTRRVGDGSSSGVAGGGPDEVEQEDELVRASSSFSAAHGDRGQRGGAAGGTSSPGRVGSGTGAAGSGSGSDSDSVD